jgi:hypothetical protein
MLIPDAKRVTARRERILESIRDAFRVVINDMFLFTEGSGTKLAAEYLLTVRIAEKIAETNVNNGEPLRVHLEHPTGTFATNCFPIYQHHNGRFIPRQRLQTKRSGNIDIAVGREYNGITIPVCAIEVNSPWLKSAPLLKSFDAENVSS